VERVILTGGNGFIGRHLVEKLLIGNLSRVIIISNTFNLNDRYFSELKKLEELPLTFYTADIRDRESIIDIFKREEADTCIHLAAKVSAADSIKNPKETMDINSGGTLNVLEACHISRVNNFVFASSAAVYGNIRQLPIKESSTLGPLSPYGKSKMLAEHHILSYKRSRKIQNAAVLRIFNPYGNGKANAADVITNFAGRLSKGLAPIIYGDGMQTRDFISVDDIAEGIILSTDRIEATEDNNLTLSSLAFNIGTGKPTSISELAQKMIRIFGGDLQPIYKDGKDRRGILHSYANTKKAKKILRFSPKKGIDEGLNEIIGPMLIQK
jgi:UDP-glucose 4-epimerase